VLSFRLRDGIRNILAISTLGNQYIQSNKPWVLVKGSDVERYIFIKLAFLTFLKIIFRIVV